MRDFGKVAPSFWTGTTGKKIRALGPDCQLTALYLITCPTANAIGMYYLSLPVIAHELGIPLKGASKALQRLSEAGFCTYDESSEYVFIPRMASFQIGDALEPSDNRIKWIKRELKALTSCPFFNGFLTEYSERFHLQDVERVSPSEAPSEGQSLTLTPAQSPSQSRSQSPRTSIEAWFARVFQPEYPEHRRHNQEPTARTVLKQLKPDDSQRSAILADLTRWKASTEWLKDGGEFVPGIGKFFKEKYYEREPQNRPVLNGHTGPSGVDLVKTMMREEVEGGTH